MKADDDQELAGIRDSMPRVWWSLYQGCLQVGFGEKVALSMVQAWILSMNPHGIRPDNPYQKPSEE